MGKGGNASSGHPGSWQVFIDPAEGSMSFAAIFIITKLLKTFLQFAKLFSYSREKLLWSLCPPHHATMSAGGWLSIHLFLPGSTQ